MQPPRMCIAVLQSQLRGTYFRPLGVSLFSFVTAFVVTMLFIEIHNRQISVAEWKKHWSNGVETQQFVASDYRESRRQMFRFAPELVNSRY